MTKVIPADDAINQALGESGVPEARYQSSPIVTIGGTEKVAKARRQHQHKALPRLTDHNAKQEKAYAAALASTFRQVGSKVAEQVEHRLKQHPMKKIAKADDDEDIDWDYAGQIAAGVDLSGLKVVVDNIEDLGASVSGETGRQALAQIGYKDNSDLVNLVDQRAADWAKTRAAQLVSIGGDKNIVDSTQNMIRQIVYDGIMQGKRTSEIAEDIADIESYPFSDERASLIARTEISSAHSQGALIGYKVARDDGVAVKKEWDTSGNETVCDECQDNEDAGPIDLDDEFPSGDDATPAHPECACVLVPFIDEDTNGDDDAGSDEDEDEDDE